MDKEMKKKINLKEYFDNMKIDINDLRIKVFHFNFLQVNTLVCYDSTKKGVIVDPGMANEAEQKMLSDFIAKEELTILFVLNTHPHIDHVLGNDYCVNNFGAKLLAHEEGMLIYINSADYGATFNFPDYHYPTPHTFINDKDIITFGAQNWEVLYTPGHADGSVCFYDATNKLVIVGDVLFRSGIGRTDLPTGNYKMLIQNIKEKLLTLAHDVLVIPGHSETTTIGSELMNNPYF